MRNIDLVAAGLANAPDSVAEKAQAAKYSRLPTPYRPGLFQDRNICC
jgi:hypothetical protein